MLRRTISLYLKIKTDLEIFSKFEALREYFKSKNAKINENINLSDIVENLNDLIKNLDCLYNSDVLEAGRYLLLIIILF